VITQLGVYGFDDATKQLKLLALHPGVTLEDVYANSAMEFLVPEKIETTQPPTAEERRALREIDPAGMVIGK
jgi:glutaconate CoA-transferase, subunit B